MVSRTFAEAVKLAPLKAYRIAQEAGLHPSTLSKILNGIEPVRPNDSRVLAVGRVLGLSPESCFEPVKARKRSRGFGSTVRQRIAGEVSRILRSEEQ